MKRTDFTRMMMLTTAVLALGCFVSTSPRNTGRRSPTWTPPHSPIRSQPSSPSQESDGESEVFNDQNFYIGSPLLNWSPGQFSPQLSPTYYHGFQSPLFPGLSPLPDFPSPLRTSFDTRSPLRIPNHDEDGVRKSSPATHSVLQSPGDEISVPGLLLSPFLETAENPTTLAPSLHTPASDHSFSSNSPHIEPQTPISSPNDISNSIPTTHLVSPTFGREFSVHSPLKSPFSPRTSIGNDHFLTESPRAWMSSPDMIFDHSPAMRNLLNYYRRNSLSDSPPGSPFLNLNDSPKTLTLSPQTLVADVYSPNDSPHDGSQTRISSPSAIRDRKATAYDFLGDSGRKFPANSPPGSPFLNANGFPRIPVLSPHTPTYFNTYDLPSSVLLHGIPSSPKAIHQYGTHFEDNGSRKRKRNEAVFQTPPSPVKGDESPLLSPLILPNSMKDKKKKMQ